MTRVLLAVTVGLLVAAWCLWRGLVAVIDDSDLDDDYERWLAGLVGRT